MTAERLLLLGGGALIGIGALVYWADWLRALVGTKRLLVPLLGAGLGLLCLSISLYGRLETWSLLRVAAVSPPFLDFRILFGSSESLAAGFDPAVENPFDPAHRKFNYLRVWYAVLAIGLDSRWAVPAAVALIGLFAAAVIGFPARLGRRSSVCMALVFFSPPVLLGIERGNFDMLAFVLLAVALLLADASRPAALLALLAGVLLKLFPILGVGAVVDEDRKRSLRSVVTAVALTLLYVVSEAKDVRRVLAATQKGVDSSYGVTVLGYSVNSLLLIGPGLTALLLYAVALRVLIGVVWLGAADRVAAGGASADRAAAGHIAAGQDASNDPDPRNLRAFRAGAGIYVGTFLMGNNWEYRMMFLLFTLPQVADWLKSGSGRSLSMARTALVSLMLSVWSPVWRAPLASFSLLDGLGYLADQASRWLLFAALSYLLAYSLPQWVLDAARSLAARWRLSRRRAEQPAR